MWLIFSNLEAKNYHIFSSMNTNHECKNSQLSDALSGFCSKNINLAHIMLISLLMMALCKARTVCFSRLSTCFDSRAKADSRMLPKKDTSKTQERIKLVQRYIDLFGIESIDCLLADREFVGERWHSYGATTPASSFIVT